MVGEAGAGIAQAIGLLPWLEMLGIGAHGNVRLEVLLAERIGQLDALFDVVEILAIGEQVEEEDFHVRQMSWHHGCVATRSAAAVVRWGKIQGKIALLSTWCDRYVPVFSDTPPPPPIPRS